jgi:hypothetical protein
MAGCPPTAAEMAQIRADVAAVALDLSCQIQRKAVTSDGMGQGSEVYNTVATVNVGMISPSATHLQNYDYLIGALSTWQVNFPYGTDVRAQDHLVIGSDTLVVQVNLSLQSYSSLTTVLASEVK